MIYKDKYICGDCRKCYKRKIVSDLNLTKEDEKPATCPQCGKPTMWIGPKFRPPKSTELASWESIEVMRRVGFAGFFGFSSDNISIPKGKKELLEYLEKLDSNFEVTVSKTILTVEQKEIKTGMKRRVETEIRNLKSRYHLV